MGLCLICGKNISKYKCSKCFCPYCSVDCWKIHGNEKSCVKKKSAKNDLHSNAVNRKYFTEDTVENEKLCQLRESKALKLILKNKSLQKMLIAVDQATNPEETLQKAMMNPDFLEFVDECLKTVQSENC